MTENIDDLQITREGRVLTLTLNDPKTPQLAQPRHV